MHSDERRDARHLKSLVYAQVARDPAPTFDALERAEATVRDLRARLKTRDASLARLTRQHKELVAEHREVAEQLRAGTEDRSVPARSHTAGQRDAGSSDVPEELDPVATPESESGPDPVPTASPDPAVEVQPEGEKAAPVVASVPPASDVTESEGDTTARVETERPLTDLSLDELLALLQRAPSAAVLASCLNRLWYREGEITRCAELLAAHRKLVPGFTAKQRHTADRVTGTVALRENLEKLVPPRVRGAAYLPERDRVLYCAYSTPLFHSNGYSVRTEGVVAGLKAAGADVTVLARAGYPWDITTAGSKPRKRRHVVQHHGVDWVHLPEGDIGAQGPDVYINVAADAVVRQARLSRPSLIHAASNYLNALPALMAARRLGLPFVYEVRGLWEVTEASAKDGWETTERYAHQAAMEAFVAGQADAVLAITQETKDELVRRGVAEERISLLPNGVNTAAFLPLPRDSWYAKARKIRTDVPVVGFAGSFVAYEGLYSLLQAANILRGRKVKFQMVLAGAGGVYEELKSYQTRNHLESHVRFVGRLPAADIPRLLSCVDIVACPRLSLPVTEMVSPLKPLEAFAASKPVVLSDVSPHRVLVGAENGATRGPRGLLSTAGNPKSLANALQELIENPEQRTAMGRAGRLWAVDERQWPDLGGEIRRTYATAHRRHDAEATAGRPLRELRLGVIADEFTTETLRRSASTIPLNRDGFRDQLRTEKPDLVFIESAWAGNDGQWQRGVGYYSDEEHAPFRALLRECRALGIPTVFWNKEDPVHINRFRRTGALCDHVFTTDADMIPEYLTQARTLSGGRAVTASSLPFYAQPAIHNPLPGHRPPEDTVAYAGTYYGERYAERSRQLADLLRLAKPYGLAIYDRQLAVPDSPYHFPPEFTGSVRGALPYGEVIDSYRAHAASLNVNSVAYSPSMFSRRVVEIAACGGVVLSGWSRGVAETFDGSIPCTNNRYYANALLSAWTTDPAERLSEAWLQLRTVLRSHTVDTALITLARTAGLCVAGFTLPSWGVDIEPEAAPHIARQSVLPVAVRLASDDTGARTTLQAQGIRVLTAADPVPEDVAFWGVAPASAPRTWAEDLLQATRWGQWQKLVSRQLPMGDPGRRFAVPGQNTAAECGLVDRSVLSGSPHEALRRDGPVTLTLTVPADPTSTDALAPAETTGTPEPHDLDTVLIAGHDLKFAASWLDHLRATGTEVLVDQWEGHAHHDEARSLELLERADTVFCEWGLGNAIWYSQHVSARHRLVVRVHAQELRGPYLRKVRHSAVDQYVFVSELMREAAISSHGVPRSKTAVIPNIVHTEGLRRPKSEAAAKTIGFVGMVPQLKRLDRAVDVIERVAAQDPQFTLRIKGKRPEDYPWMHKRPEEMAWYRDCYERIDALNREHGRDVVRFDPHGDDMTQWYREIGYGLSLSDHESFHLTLPDVAASGGVPVALDWPGADLIYPRDWLVADLDELAQRILEVSRLNGERAAIVRRASEFVEDSFDEDLVFTRLDRTLRG